MVQPGEQLDAARAMVNESAVAAGRDPGAIGMEGRVDWRGDADDVARRVEGWRAVGATHLGINTMGAGLTTVDDHLNALAAVSERLPLD